MLQFPHKMSAYVYLMFYNIWQNFQEIGCYVSRKEIFHVYVYTLENIHRWIKPTKTVSISPQLLCCLQ